MKNLKSKAIGIFDSGVGGLTVAQQIFKKLPSENVVYFGDTARTRKTKSTRKKAERKKRRVSKTARKMEKKKRK